MRITQDNFVKTESADFEALIIRLLFDLQLGACEDCGDDLLEKGYQLTHKRYGLDIALRDLALKCGGCHAKERGHEKHTGTLRHVLGYV